MTANPKNNPLGKVAADERKGMKRVSGLAEVAVNAGQSRVTRKKMGERGNERNGPSFHFATLVLALVAVRSTLFCYSSRLAALWKILPGVGPVVRASMV
jgi:hypothetical protein